MCILTLYQQRLLHWIIRLTFLSESKIDLSKQLVKFTDIYQLRNTKIFGEYILNIENCIIVILNLYKKLNPFNIYLEVINILDSKPSRYYFNCFCIELVCIIILLLLIKLVYHCLLLIKFVNCVYYHQTSFVFIKQHWKLYFI